MTQPSTSLHFTYYTGDIADDVAPHGFNLIGINITGNSTSYVINAINALPANCRAFLQAENQYLVGADATFKAMVDAVVANTNANAKTWGWYLADEPDDTAAAATNLQACCTYIHGKNAAHKCTMVHLVGGNGDQDPTFPTRFLSIGMDYWGLDPYPNHYDYGPNLDLTVIKKAVTAANAAGYPTAQLFPVYQGFGDGGTTYKMMTPSETSQHLDAWGAVLPTPPLDAVFQWNNGGAPNVSISDAGQSAVLAVFAAHNVNGAIFNSTLADITVSAAGTAAATGVLTATLGDVVLYTQATGATGAFAATCDAIAVAAVGTTTAIVANAWRHVAKAATTWLKTNASKSDPLTGLVTTQIASPAGFVDRLYLNTHNTTDADAIRAMGFVGVRTDMLWQYAEPVTPGVYDFTDIDSRYNAHASVGLKVHWVVGYGNSLYADGGNPDGLPVGTTNVNAYKDFVVAAVNHLPHGGSYELMNEWQDVFNPEIDGATKEAALITTTAPAILAADPTATVLTGAPGGYVNTYSFDLMLTALGNNLHGCAGVSVHPYQFYNGSGSNNADPEYYFDPGNYKAAAVWQGVLNSHGLTTTPTYGTESGYDYTALTPATRDQQANIVLRHFFAGWISGYKQWTLYDHDDGGYGLIYNSKCVAAITYFTGLAIGKKATGYKLTDTAETATGALNVLRFADNSTAVYALWVRTGSKNQTVPEGVRAYSMIGADITAKTVTITAADGPVYLVVPLA